MDLFNKKKLEEKEIVIEAKRKKIVELTEQNEYLIKQNKDLTKNSLNLTDENKKLINWIEKIINEAGVQITNRNDRHIVNVPYYETETELYKAADIGRGTTTMKEIIIPSIVVRKYIGGY